MGLTLVTAAATLLTTTHAEPLTRWQMCMASCVSHAEDVYGLRGQNLLSRKEIIDFCARVYETGCCTWPDQEYPKCSRSATRKQ